jgi:two-component system response regulator HydG
VRELEHLVERLVVTSDKETVDGAAVRAALALPAQRSPSPFGSFDPLPTLRDLEQQYIDHVLDRTEGNKTRAADILGIDPSTLHRRSKTRPPG